MMYIIKEFTKQNISGAFFNDDSDKDVSIKCHFADCWLICDRFASTFGGASKTQKNSNSVKKNNVLKKKPRKITTYSST